MSCLGECWDLGPPPDQILFLPPPPAPSLFQLRNILDNVTAPCAATQLCEWGGAVASNAIGSKVAQPSGGGSNNAAHPSGDSGTDYVDMSQHEIESTWSGGDTWLLVLVASSIGVLFLGALLALFLLKCREDHRAQTKHIEQRQIPATAATTTKSRIHQAQPDLGDNRMVWAALTPRGGTQHYVSEGSYRVGSHHLPPPPVPPPPQPHLLQEPEYETIDEHYASSIAYQQQRYGKQGSFDNSGYYFPGFTDYDYEEPTPLMQMGYGQQQDMRCISTLRRLAPPISRPRVSSPTRIEHPNLPPLNLNPQLMGTTKRGTLSRRPSETNAILKYNIN